MVNMVSIVGLTNGSSLILGDDGNYYYFLENYSTLDAQDGEANDSTVSLDTFIENLDHPYYYKFEADGDYTMAAGGSGEIIVTRHSDGSVLLIDPTESATDGIWDWDHYTATDAPDPNGGISSGDDSVIQLEYLFTHAPQYTDNIHLIEDSSGEAFTVERFTDAQYLVTRADGSTYIMNSPLQDSRIDRYEADTTDPVTGEVLTTSLGTADGITDISAAIANLTTDSDVFQIINSNGGTFEIIPASGEDAIIQTSGNEAFIFDEVTLERLQDSNGVVDVANFDGYVSSLSAGYRFYKVTDSVGDFEILPSSVSADSSDNMTMVQRADGSVVMWYNDKANEIADRYGANDNIMDIQDIVDNTADTTYTTVWMSSDPSLTFYIEPGGEYSTLHLSDGSVYSFANGWANVQTYTRYQADGSLDPYDGVVDIVELVAYLETKGGGVGNLIYKWDNEPAAAPCFTAGTLIKTASGLVAVEDLKRGDKILTKDSGHQAIKWIGRTAVNAASLRSNPKLRPIKIVAGALGNNLPNRDLVVSRQHRMFANSPIVKRMFGEDEVLVAAIALTAMPGVYIDETVATVEYFHMAFDAHEVIFAEGAPTESLYVGPNAMKAMSKDQRAELEVLFPEVLNAEGVIESAAFIPMMKKQKNLIARHAKNNKALLA